MIRRLFLTLVLAAGVLTLTATAAPAVDIIPGIGDGPNAPTPQQPDEGLSGKFIDAPDPLPPATADPFRPGSPYSVFDVYGFAGTRGNTYDLGSATNPGNWVDIAGAKQNTMWENLWVGMATTFSGLGHSTQEQAYAPSWLNVFDSISDRLNEVVGGRIFWRYMPFGLLIAAAMIIFAARGKADLAGASGTLAWVLVVIVVAVFVLSMPLWIAQGAQSLMRQVNVEVSATSSDAGVSRTESIADASTSRIYEAVHYDSILNRMLGDADSATARKHGPDLFRGISMSWREAAVCDAAPKSDRCESIYEDKATLFEETAEKVKDEDPRAYEWLQGKHGRGGTAFAELIAAGSAETWRIVSSIVVMVAVGLLVCLAIAFPVGAVATVIPGLEHIGKGMLNGAARAIGKGLGFGVFAVLWNLVVQAVLDPGLDMAWWLQVLVLLLLTVATLFALAPHRAILSMISLGKYGSGPTVAGKAFSKLLDYESIKHANKEALEEAADEPADETRYSVPKASPPPAPQPDVDIPQRSPWGVPRHRTVAHAEVQAPERLALPASPVLIEAEAPPEEPRQVRVATGRRTDAVYRHEDASPMHRERPVLYVLEPVMGEDGEHVYQRPDDRVGSVR